MGESAAAEVEIVSRSKDAGGECEQSIPEDGAVGSGDEEPMILVESECEESGQDSKVPESDDIGYQTHYAGDVLQPTTDERGPGRNEVVAPQIDASSPQEGESGNIDVDEESVENNDVDVESETEGEGPDPALQSQRPVRVRRPPDRYGEWIVSSLQQIANHLQMLEDKQTMDRERIKKLKPKLLKKARALKGH